MSRESILTVDKVKVLRAYLSKLYNASRSVALGVVESVACENRGIYREHYYSFGRLSENALGGRNPLDKAYSWEIRCRCITEYAHRMDVVASHIEFQTGESLTELCERHRVLKTHIRKVLVYANKGYTGERSPEYSLYTKIFGSDNVPADCDKLMRGYIERLSPRQRVLLKMRTGIGSNLYLLREVSSYFNITDSKVCMIEKRCYGYIRGFAKEEQGVAKNGSKSIQSLGLSPRAETCLLRAGYDTVDKLNGVKKRDLRAVRNLGMRCCDEVVSKLLSQPNARVSVVKPEGGSQQVKVKDYSDVTPDMVITFNYDKF